MAVSLQQFVWVSWVQNGARSLLYEIARDIGIAPLLAECDIDLVGACYSGIVWLWLKIGVRSAQE
jgi:hypothetical protein